MTNSPLSQAESTLKRLEDEVQLARQEFEEGLECRNTGARAKEIQCWAAVRRHLSQASEEIADLSSRVGAL